MVCDFGLFSSCLNLVLVFICLVFTYWFVFVCFDWSLDA